MVAHTETRELPVFNLGLARRTPSARRTILANDNK
jgi:hypothetical protein